MAGQLNLFGGPKQRGRKPPTPVEFIIQVMVADTLRRFMSPAWRFTHVPLGEKRDKVTAARLKRMGTTPGWPDLQFCGPDRTMLFLELKRYRQDLTDEQDEIRRHIEACGFPYRMADSYDAAIKILQDAGILPRGLKVQ